ncbi:hypothetical protein [Streptomyces sp. NPDC093109]|uniref:hypothetical protein n=1 Tax=Streptomyces sp. NPDC093109 TaxID=3154977 RepID=UPI00344FC821
MRTDRPPHLARVLCFITVLAICFGIGAAGAPVALAGTPAVLAADDPKDHVDYGPGSSKNPPEEWQGDVGIDSNGNYCHLYRADDCRQRTADEGVLQPCEGADGTGSTGQCGEEGRKAFEVKQLEKWRQQAKEEPDFQKRDAMLTACVDEGGSFRECRRQAYDKYPAEPWLGNWVYGAFSKMASDALQEAARYVGRSVVWLLDEFAKVFNSASTIDLSKVGIGSVTAMMTALSVVIATFLLLLQFGKVAVSQRGEPAATAVVGLVKWAVISAVYFGVTQTALIWSDAVSTWIINESFDGTGSAQDKMQQQLGTLFGGLIVGGGGGATAGTALIAGNGVTAAAVGVIIVVGIVCILAISALWIEVLLRQAGIMILMATMPVVLAGQMADSTSEWWPKARNALIALVLMKPLIVVCFAIGFGAMAGADTQGVQNMFVGLLIFVIACFAWPVLAKFMTFSTVGGGGSVASGLMSSVGSSAGSMTGGYRPEMSGAGAVGGGSNYTRALERDTAQTMSSGSNAAASAGSSPGAGAGSTGGGQGGAVRGGARFGGKVAAGVGLGLQALAVGKDVLESGMANTAAHAGLDHGGGGGRHVVVPPRRAGAPQQQENPPAPAVAPRDTPASPKEGN